MVTRDDLYYCYSLRLFHFLKQKGFYYLCKGYFEDTKRNFWVFSKGEELHKALLEFAQIKDTYKQSATNQKIGGFLM